MKNSLADILATYEIIHQLMLAFLHHHRNPYTHTPLVCNAINANIAPIGYLYTTHPIHIHNISNMHTCECNENTLNPPNACNRISAQKIAWARIIETIAVIFFASDNNSVVWHNQPEILVFVVDFHKIHLSFLKNWDFICFINREKIFANQQN